MLITLKKLACTCPKLNHTNCKHPDPVRTSELAGLQIKTLRVYDHYQCDRDTLLEAVKRRDGAESPSYRYWAEFLSPGQLVKFPQEEAE